MTTLTITLPAEWLERIDHVVGFGLSPVGGGGEDFVIIKRSRLASQANAAEMVLRGCPSVQELSKVLNGIEACIDTWLETLDGPSPKRAKISYGEGPDGYARQHLESLADEVRAITVFLSEQNLGAEMWGERSLKVALMLLKQMASTARPDKDEQLEGEIRALQQHLCTSGDAELVREGRTLKNILALLEHRATRVKELDAMALSATQDRDTAVELLNNLFKPCISSTVAATREAEARDWLKRKGWMAQED